TLYNKNALMNTSIAKETLHRLIDQIEDEELLRIYIRLLERELGKSSSKDFFKTTDEDLISRASNSLKSIEEGKTRSIEDFKKDVELWKKNKAM
ncbi:MAG: hypothetical protein AAFX87_25735, partial [Bacteroidota bacterium]